MDELIGLDWIERSVLAYFNKILRAPGVTRAGGRGISSSPSSCCYLAAPQFSSSSVFSKNAISDGCSTVVLQVDGLIGLDWISLGGKSKQSKHSHI